MPGHARAVDKCVGKKKDLFALFTRSSVTSSSLSGLFSHRSAE
jgi:hypothetical protein